MCNKNEFSFWFYFEKQRRWRIQLLLRTRKHYPAAAIQTCVHQGRLGKAKTFCFLNKTKVIESCSQERITKKWRFYKLTNFTVFEALLNDVPMGCKDAVLPEPLLENHTINCLTFEENSRQPY